MHLDITRFLAEFVHSDFSKKCSVMYFVGVEYPFHFFVQLRSSLKKQGFQVEHIDIVNYGLSTIQERLSASFLGTSIYYFISEYSDDIGAGTRERDFFVYLQTYIGPHTIIVYRSPEKQVKYVDTSTTYARVIRIPDTIDKATYTTLVSWFGIAVTASIKQSIQQIYKKFNNLSFEQACATIRYVPLGGTDSSLESLLLQVCVTPEHSLFSLSQYFFQKDARRFFEHWRSLKDTNSRPFWVLFWSEQLWRASMFIWLTRQQKHTDARKIAFRLPFSFMNRDWRQYTDEELTAAHDFLYKLDRRLKIHSDSDGLDLFYFLFLFDMGRFKRDTSSLVYYNEHKGVFED